MNNKLVLVTGASTGLGLAITKTFADKGYTVVATARESSLSRFHPELIARPNILIRALDVVDHQQRQTLINELEKDHGGVDILINNAGTSYRAVVEDMSEDEEHKQMEVNFAAPMSLSRLVLPSMRKKRQGSILNISSVAGMMAMPTMSSYSASKFALEGAMESLWYEMRPWGIRIKLIQPGFVNSDSFLNVVLPPKAQASRHEGPYKAYYESMEPFVAKIMRSALATPESVARRVLKISERARWKLRHAATMDARMFYILRRILPRDIYHNILYYSLPGRRHWSKG